MSMALDNAKPGVGANRTPADMNRDIWRLILDQIDSLKDLCNVCLTSRAWFDMAIPHLYKVVPLVSPNDRRDMKGKASNFLSYRLLDPRSEQFRNAVHEIDFACQLGEMEKRLVALVDSLPNLQRVKIRGQLTQEALRDLVRPDRGISLYLLNENGQRPIEYDLPNVVSLAAKVNPLDVTQGPNLHVLGIQELLFACPNLKSFSFETVGGYGGCRIYRPRYETVNSFRFYDDRSFPPLEEMSLSGYGNREADWGHWHAKFQWSKLRSLALGPRSTADFLRLAASHATSLRDLKVQVYTDADRKTDCPPLEHFLTTFTSLESLTIKGYHVPVRPIGNHPGLKHLWLHPFERSKWEIPRPTFDVEQLQELDKSCANLETLELDLYRDGEWPEPFLKALATGFKNLRRLTLHLELGLQAVVKARRSDPDRHFYIQPILDENSAKGVGQQFFKWRSSSKLSTLVLKTGEPLRRFPQWEPPYIQFERKNTYTVEIYNPWNTGGVPEVMITARPRLVRRS